jgi:cation/acetate symporter
MRCFGIFTVPDFLGARYEGHLPRLLGIVVLFSASFTYLVAQTVGVGIITSRFLQIPFEVAVFVGLAGILVCSMLGGMRAVTWTQVAQYIVLIVAYILPVAILSAQLYGLPIPELTYGQALQEISRLEQQMGIDKAHVAPFVQADALNFFALILCLMIGTASLPHILMRYFTTPSVRAARMSVGWSLFFIFLLYFTAPAYAAFAKLEVYTHVISGRRSRPCRSGSADGAPWASSRSAMPSTRRPPSPAARPTAMAMASFSFRSSSLPRTRSFSRRPRSRGCPT